MRILTINYRYFVSGGPERYLFNVTSLLQEHQHSVVPFSVQHPHNRPSEYSGFFLSPLGRGDEVYFSQLARSPRSMLRLTGRTFYSLEAKRKLGRLLDAHDVDIGYILHFLRWISPSVIDVLKERHVPVVVRASDYSYLCPQAHFLRDGQICELCLKGTVLHSLQHKCLQNSYLVSGVNLLSVYTHRLMGVMDKIDAFVCPSGFLLKKMREGGIGAGRLHHIPTFVESSRFAPEYEPGPYVLYFGRIAREKGVETLIDAAAELKKNPHYSGLQVKLAGRSNQGELERLQKAIRRSGVDGVEFLGDLDFEPMQRVIRGCACAVVPSLWYDNMPNTILETFASGKTVIASNSGSLPETVQDGNTGLLFEAGDHRDLADKIARLLDDRPLIRKLGRNARHVAETEYSPSVHYDRLMNLFHSFTGEAPPRLRSEDRRRRMQSTTFDKKLILTDSCPV